MVLLSQQQYACFDLNTEGVTNLGLAIWLLGDLLGVLYSWWMVLRRCCAALKPTTLSSSSSSESEGAVRSSTGRLWIFA